VERRLAAILAADVVGYSRLMDADEAGTMVRLEGLKAEILDLLIAQHHGRIVMLMGVGFLVEFASVLDALTCALVWQGFRPIEDGFRSMTLGPLLTLSGHGPSQAAERYVKRLTTATGRHAPLCEGYAQRPVAPSAPNGVSTIRAPVPVG